MSVAPLITLTFLPHRYRTLHCTHLLLSSIVYHSSLKFKDLNDLPTGIIFCRKQTSVYPRKLQHLLIVCLSVCQFVSHTLIHSPYVRTQYYSSAGSTLGRYKVGTYFVTSTKRGNHGSHNGHFLGHHDILAALPYICSAAPTPLL